MKKDSIFILFGFLIILIFFLTYFDIDNFIINTLTIFSKREKFTQIFIPNKLFKYQNKIFLLDTRSLLKNDVNPLVFNSFNEYSEYIMSLESKFKDKLNKTLKSKISSAKNIDDIKELPLQNNIKLVSEDINPYYKNYECDRMATKCSLDINEPTKDLVEKSENDESVINILGYENLNNFQKEVCKKRLVDEKKCRAFLELDKNARYLNTICLKDKNNPYLKNLCKKHNFFQDNKYFIKEECAEKDRKTFSEFKQKCMLEDFFRENMLEFDF